MSGIDAYRVVDESGGEVLADPFGNNVAFHCPVCHGPVLAVVRQHQRGGKPDNPSHCRTCRAKYWVEQDELGKRLILHQLQAAPKSQQIDSGQESLGDRSSEAVAPPTVRELLTAYLQSIDALRARGICRSKNNPVADYAEWLVADRLGLQLTAKSNVGYDATAANGTRYEIKSRRVTPDNSSLQLVALRGLNLNQFDFLVGVVFEADFSVRYAAKIPHEAVVRLSTYTAHTNSHRFIFRKSVLTLRGVEVLTDLLRP